MLKRFITINVCQSPDEWYNMLYVCLYKRYMFHTNRHTDGVGLIRLLIKISAM